jgi:hypothetical protein
MHLVVWIAKGAVSTFLNEGLQYPSTTNACRGQPIIEKRQMITYKIIETGSTSRVKIKVKGKKRSMDK